MEPEKTTPEKEPETEHGQAVQESTTVAVTEEPSKEQKITIEYLSYDIDLD